MCRNNEKGFSELATISRKIKAKCGRRFDFARLRFSDLVRWWIYHFRMCSLKYEFDVKVLEGNEAIYLRMWITNVSNDFSGGDIFDGADTISGLTLSSNNCAEKERDYDFTRMGGWGGINFNAWRKSPLRYEFRGTNAECSNCTARCVARCIDFAEIWWVGGGWGTGGSNPGRFWRSYRCKYNESGGDIKISRIDWRNAFLEQKSTDANRDNLLKKIKERRVDNSLQRAEYMVFPERDKELKSQGSITMRLPVDDWGEGEFPIELHGDSGNILI